MRWLGIIFFTFLLPICFCCANDLNDQNTTSYSEVKMLRNTRDALLSYDIVQERKEYWETRLQNLIMGEFAEKLIFLSPFVTGKLEFRANDLRFYVDARHEESGVQYVYRF